MEIKFSELKLGDKFLWRERDYYSGQIVNHLMIREDVYLDCQCCIDNATHLDGIANGLSAHLSDTDVIALVTE